MCLTRVSGEEKPSGNEIKSGAQLCWNNKYILFPFVSLLQICYSGGFLIGFKHCFVKKKTLSLITSNWIKPWVNVEVCYTKNLFCTFILTAIVLSCE